MKFIGCERAFTFLEAILAIVILAIAIPPLLALFTGITIGGARSHAIPTLAALASELMEEVKSRKFDELSEKGAGGNWSGTLGPDDGEVNKANFDDVDDFNGWTQDFGTGFSDYTAVVSVGYVASNDLNTPLAIPSPLPGDWTPSYKRVVVSISYGGLNSLVELKTIVTEVQSL